MKLVLIVSAFLFISVFHSNSSVQAAVLSREQAFQILKVKGFKWQLTETLSLESESKLAQAKSEFAPHFGLGFRQYLAKINPIQFGGTNPETIDVIGFGTTALEMNWTFLDPLTKAKILSAEANDQMTGAQSKHYQNELTALMLVQYLTVQRLHKQLELMEANLKKSQLIVKLASAKKSVGAGIPLDVARAKNLEQLDQLKKISTKVKLNKATHDLALLLSEEKLDFQLEELQPQLFSFPKNQSEINSKESLRSDLKSAEFAVLSASNANNEAQRRFFPKLSLLAEVGTTQPTLLGWPAKSANGFLGISLSIPLETGGFLTAKRQEVAVLKRKAELQYQQTKAEVKMQEQEAVEQLNAALEALNASADYLKTAQEESQIAENRYRYGASNILDLTTAHTNLASATDTRIENIFNFEAAKVNYFRSLGDFTEYFALDTGGNK